MNVTPNTFHPQSMLRCGQCFNKKMFAWPRTSVFSMLCERNNFGFGLNFTKVCKETSDLQGRSQGKTYQFSSFCTIKYGEYNTHVYIAFHISFHIIHMRQKRVIKSPFTSNKITTKRFNYRIEKLCPALQRNVLHFFYPGRTNVLHFKISFGKAAVVKVW